jgi:hypothetical protein
VAGSSRLGAPRPGARPSKAIFSGLLVRRHRLVARPTQPKRSRDYPHGVPYDYCGLEGTGVNCPVGLGVRPSRSVPIDAVGPRRVSRRLPRRRVESPRRALRRPRRAAAVLPAYPTDAAGPDAERAEAGGHRTGAGSADPPIRLDVAETVIHVIVVLNEFLYRAGSDTRSGGAPCCDDGGSGCGGACAGIRGQLRGKRSAANGL